MRNASIFAAAPLGFSALLACALLALPASAARGAEPDPFRLRLSVQAGYDDNILQLSEDELREFEEDPDPDQFLIESTDDVITRARAELRWETNLWKERRTYWSARITAYIYATNDVKDYEEYLVGVDQEIHRPSRHRSWVELEYTRTPSRYSREITDDDAALAAGTRIRESLIQETDEYWLSYRQRILGRALELEGGYRLEVMEYGTHFPERDAVRSTWVLQGRSEPLETWPFQFTISEEFGTNDAEGNLASTTFEDDDPSYTFYTTTIQAEFPWSGGHFEAEIEIEYRNYTTDNPLDTVRFDREDDRRTYTGRVEQTLSPGLLSFAEYRRRDVDADLPREAAATDEDTDYVEDLVLLGIRWELSF